MAVDVYKAILKRRSIRSFKQKRIPLKLLRHMVNAARLAPSAANLQPLEFLIVNDRSLCQQLLKRLKWAVYIAPAGNPKPGCEPVSYIIILAHDHNADRRDIGAAAENIMLLAQSEGIATCWLGAIDTAAISNLFALPYGLIVDSVIALGYPDMVSKTAKFKGSVQYYLDTKGILHVPKKPLNRIMHLNKIKS